VDLDVNTLFTALVGLITAVLGWYVRSMKDSIDALHKADQELTKEVNKLNVLVVGDYVRQSHMTEFRSEVISRLNDISGDVRQGFKEVYERIERKADK
jgi:hypothetical protein